MITAHTKWNKKDFTKSELIQEYVRVKKALGNKTPTNIEFKQHSFIKYSWLIRKYRYWNNFLRDMGDVPHIQARAARQRNYGRPSDSELINQYLILKQALGRDPSWVEMTKLGKYTGFAYMRHWGSWNKFLESIGESTIGRSQKRKYRAKEELIASYLKYKERFRKVPKYSELIAFNGYSHHLYKKYFGNYTNFIKEMGDEKETERKEFLKGRKEYYLNKYVELTAQLGAFPLKKDFEVSEELKYANLCRYFGGLANVKALAVESDSLPIFLKNSLRPLTKKYGIRTKEEMINVYKEFKASRGYVPSESEFVEYSGILRHWVKKLFGTYRKFLFSIGDLGKRKIDLKRKREKENQIQEYIDLVKALGRFPDKSDLENAGKSSYVTYHRLLGGLPRLKEWVVESGQLSDTLRQKLLPEVNRGRPRTKQDLVDAYLECRRLSGTIPTQNELKIRYGIIPYWIRKHFGDFKQFVSEMELNTYK